MTTFSYHRVGYSRDADLERRIGDIVSAMGWHYIDTNRLVVIRSTGTKSRRILARCHALSRIFQEALGVDAHYIVEILSENFDQLSPEEQTRTLIHELMHIPRSFAGGFRHHRPYVTRRTVESNFREYLKRTNGNE